MSSVSLPQRVGPKFGTFAFTKEGEQQIYDAVHVHGMSKIAVAAEVGASLPTIDAIIRRVKGRAVRTDDPSATASDSGGDASSVDDQKPRAA